MKYRNHSYDRIADPRRHFAAFALGVLHAARAKLGEPAGVGPTHADLLGHYRDGRSLYQAGFVRGTDTAWLAGFVQHVADGGRPESYRAGVHPLPLNSPHRLKGHRL